MPTSIPAGPDPETIVTYIQTTYPETDTIEAMNAYFFSLDPDKHWPTYATLVTTDEHDDASDLDRPGAFRLNLGVDRETSDRIAAADPTRITPRSIDSCHTRSTGSSIGSRTSIRARRPPAKL